MMSILNSPFPCIYGRKENFITAALVGLFVATFLLVFKPFGIDIAVYNQDSYVTYKSIGFGVVSFLVCLFTYYVPIRIFPKFFEEKNYTVGKDLFMCALLILLIGICNSIYAHFFSIVEDGFHVGNMIWQTFLVGIFPITFLTFLQYNRLVRSNTKGSQDINIVNDNSSAHNIAMKKTPSYYNVMGEKGQIAINLEDLLFLESDGNYAHVHQFKNGTYSKTMYRTTLKSLEEYNRYANVIRCHISFIVNLDQVTNVSGNAQGLKMTIKNSEEQVPVSRKYINQVKNHFNS